MDLNTFFNTFFIVFLYNWVQRYDNSETIQNKFKYIFNVLFFEKIALSLHKICCTRQFESKLSLHSIAKSLQMKN